MSEQPPDDKPTSDCYSASEREAMVWTQRLRGRWLEPLLRFLNRQGVTPNHLTIASLMVGLAFCPLWYWSPVAALVVLATHVLLDGLDGPLARYSGVASRRGSLTDTMADQTVVVATTITLMEAGEMATVPAATYIALYTLVVVFAMIRNALSIPYSWVVRPRLIVYCCLPVQIWLAPGSIDVVLWVFNVVLALKTATGFVRIRNKM